MSFGQKEEEEKKKTQRLGTEPATTMKERLIRTRTTTWVF